MKAADVDRSRCAAERHGQYWMQAKYGCVCFDARVDHSAYRRDLRRGVRRIVPAAEATRITQGLAWAGYTGARIAELAGASERLVRELQSGAKHTVAAGKLEALRRVAASVRLDDQPSGPGPNRARLTAKRNGWVPLAAWDDETIGDPEAEPDLGGSDDDLIDEVAVERALAGGDVHLTGAELVAALQVGVARGEHLSVLAARFNLNYFAARKMLGGEVPTARLKRQRVEAAVLRSWALPDSHIAALEGVQHQTVTRARERLTARQRQLAS